MQTALASQYREGCAPQILPESVPSVYGGLTDDAIAALEGAPPAGDVARVRRYVAQQYAAIADPARALGGASEADFAWALSVRPGMLCQGLRELPGKKRIVMHWMPTLLCPHLCYSCLLLSRR